MGIVYFKHFVVGGVPAADLRAAAARHRSGASNGCAEQVFAAVERAGVDGIWADAIEGKGLDDDFDDAMDAFFFDLVGAHADARVVRASTSDHDGVEDGTRWAELARAGDEEGGPVELSWRTASVTPRIAPWFTDEDEDGDDDEDEDAGDDPEPVAAAELSELLYVILLHGEPTTLRDGAADAADPHVRACLAHLADALERGRDTTSSYPCWCHAGSAVEIAQLADALFAASATGAIGYQPHRGAMKVVHLRGEAVPSHHVLPLGFAWSPELTRLGPPAGSAPAAAPQGREPPPAIAASPHTTAVLASVAGLRIVGLKDTVQFTRLAALSVAQRRALLLDLSAHAQEHPGDVLDALCYLLVDRTDIVEHETDLEELLRAEQVLGPMARDALVNVVERFVERSGWSRALRDAVVASESLVTRAARAPHRPTSYERDKLPCRAARLLEAARGRPPFAVDAWGTVVLADLAAMSPPARRQWSDLFAAWDDHPPPFAPSAAWRSAVDERLAAVGPGAVAAQACRWIAAFAAGPPVDAGPGDDRSDRNLIGCDGLTLLAAGSGVREAALTLARAALATAPTKERGCRSPRLAYRALDLLRDAGEADALRAIADTSPYARVRRYAARP